MQKVHKNLVKQRERQDDKNQRSFEESQKNWMDLLLTLNSLGGRKAPNGIFYFITF